MPDAGAPFQPIVRDEQAGTVRAWCACGKSEKQPFCDGSHVRLAPGVEPLRVTIPTSGKYPWCTCKRSKARPLCDGTHSKLP